MSVRSHCRRADHPLSPVPHLDVYECYCGEFKVTGAAWFGMGDPGEPCRYCRRSDLPTTARRAHHAVVCPKAPWNTQPGWQVAVPTSSRWTQFRLQLATLLRR